MKDRLAVWLLKRLDVYVGAGKSPLFPGEGFVAISGKIFVPKGGGVYLVVEKDG